MPEHYERYKSPYKAEELFQMVTEVEEYPNFLPWISNARIQEQHSDWFIADLMAKFKSFSHKYTSKVILKKPKNPKEIWEVNVELVSGPFKHLDTKWIFRPMNKGGTEVIFKMDFKFQSIIFEKMIGNFFDKAVSKIKEAFQKRADEKFGKK